MSKLYKIEGFPLAEFRKRMFQAIVMASERRQVSVWDSEALGAGVGGCTKDRING